jgi:Carboxypeptidase regulatory-like domain
MHPARPALAAIFLASSVATAQQVTPVKSVPAAHSVTGIVVDSLRGRLLPGAQVILHGTTHSALTDKMGGFRFDSVAAGSYTIAFFHPLLDSLSVSLPPLNLGVPLDTGRAVILAIPSARTLISAICPGNRDNGTSVLTGSVMDADTDEAIGGASIIVSWTDIEVSKELKVSLVPRLHAATTDRSGFYKVCGLPSEFDASVTASRDGQTTAELPIESSYPDVMVRSFTLGASAMKRGEKAASVSGVVKTKEGKPLEGARIAVPGANGQATSDDRGRFVLSGLPSGTRNVFVRRIGYEPVLIPVDLSSKAPRQIDAVMSKYIPVMDTVYVRARRDRALASVGFAERRRRGLGSHQTRADFEKTSPVRLTDILRSMRGVRTHYSASGVTVTGRPGAFGGGCLSLVVDRAPWLLVAPEDIDDMIFPQDIAAIEVYDGATVPPEFEVGRYRGCLTIVIWTRARIREGD